MQTAITTDKTPVKKARKLRGPNVPLLCPHCGGRVRHVQPSALVKYNEDAIRSVRRAKMAKLREARRLRSALVKDPRVQALLQQIQAEQVGQ